MTREHETSKEAATPLSEPPAPREYEQLKGKTGRQALHRPDRFSLRNLVEVPTRFTLDVGGTSVRPVNFSLSGISFRDRRKDVWEEGAETHYRVRLMDETVLEGSAVVARVTPTAKYVEVGLSSASAVDYEALRSAERNYTWNEGLSRPPRFLKGAVPDDYRNAVLELSAFCQYYRGLLGKREIHNAGDRLEIAREAFDAMLPGWQELRGVASRAAQPFLADTESLKSGRAVAEALVTPYLIEAPVLRQTFDKPFGYPGDFVLMQYYLDNAFVGDSAFGMVFHKITCEHPLAVGVRTRARWVAERIAERARQVNGCGPVRVLSLGCGVAAEVAMVHGELGVPTSAVEWTLIDQEDRALTAAHRNARACVPEGGSPPNIKCLNVSFSRLFRGEEDPSLWGPQDVMFAMGLFDYLPAAGAQMLVAAMYGLVRPGGSIYIGNASGPNDYFWELELALRWTLLYRGEGEMGGLAAGLPADADVRIEREPTGAYHILSCQKP